MGQLAPELAGTADDGSRFQLTDLAGNPLSLADLRGRAVWINFWASWCPPCQSETPTLRAMDEQYRSRGLTLIAVQVQQTVDEGNSYAARYGLKYAIGADVSAAVFRTYHVFALPTQFFIDPDGVIRAVVNGPLDRTSASATDRVDPARDAAGGNTGRNTDTQPEQLAQRVVPVAVAIGDQAGQPAGPAHARGRRSSPPPPPVRRGRP